MIYCLQLFVSFEFWKQQDCVNKSSKIEKLKEEYW